ncbi:unnamed protein product [Prunus armeniaca]
MLMLERDEETAGTLFLSRWKVLVWAGLEMPGLDWKRLGWTGPLTTLTARLQLVNRYQRLILAELQCTSCFCEAFEWAELQFSQSARAGATVFFFRASVG